MRTNKKCIIGVLTSLLATGLFAAPAQIAFFAPCLYDKKTNSVQYPHETLMVTAYQVSQIVNAKVVQYPKLTLDPISLTLNQVDEGLCYAYADLGGYTPEKSPLLFNENNQRSSIDVMGEGEKLSAGVVSFPKYRIVAEVPQGKVIYFDLYNDPNICQKKEQSPCGLTPGGLVSYFVWATQS